MDDVLTVQASRLIVAAMLFVAGLSKLRRLDRFRHGLETSGLFTGAGATLVSRAVPAAELVLPVWLLWSRESRAAAWATVALLVVFSGYVFALRAMGREIPCGCFGGLGRISDPFVGRNLGLAMMAAGGLSQRGGIYYCVAGLALLLLWIAGQMLRASQAAKRGARAGRMEDTHA